jgi:S1-C subfamily serine protease
LIALISTPTPATEPPPAGPRPRRTRWLIALAGVGAGLLGGFTLHSAPPKGPTRAEVAATASSVAAKAIDDLQGQPARAVQVYDQIFASLVVIRTKGASGDGEDDGLGTGVIVNADGSMLTAFHVIEGASSIEVTFMDGTKGAATVTAQDPANDTAVLRSDTAPEVLVPAVLGGGTRVGAEVFAVGNPLGLVGSLSAGVVSGLDRTVPVPGGGSGDLSGLIQFDAAVNPGNSGGPLLNRNAEVIGIVTGLANPSDKGFFVGIGFAVPIATAGGAAGTPRQ